MASLAWLDPSALPRQAAREYEAGEFDEAVQHYNQALIDEPDSSLLHFNLGAAEYRRGQYEAAARAVELLSDDPAAAYNRGNALYRLGEAAAAQTPQDAMKHWAEALVAYRRAIALDPADEDAKFNYEWVVRKIEELRKKQEEEQNQDQQQQGQEQQQEEKQDQAKEEPQEQPQEQEQPPPAEQAQQPEAPPEPQPGGEAAPSDGEMTEDEATALLDGERNEELRPDEVIRRQLGAGDLPGRDW
jgi:Ca-activated chloride channel family protein